MMAAMTKPAIESKGAALISTDPTLVCHSHKSDLNDFGVEHSLGSKFLQWLNIPKVQQQERERNWKNSRCRNKGLCVSLNP